MCLCTNKTYYEYFFPLFLLVYKKRLNCSQVLLDMEWKSNVKVDWKNVNGTAEKKRRLHLVTAEDGLFHCSEKLTMMVLSHSVDAESM